MRTVDLCAKGRWLLAAVVVALAATGAGPGDASADTTTSYPLGVTDCQTATELCAVIPTVIVQTSSVLMVNFTASPLHCSDIIVHILVDGAEKYVSGALAPGASTGVQNLGPVPGGTYTLGVQAQGVLGGCNSGTLASWSGTLDVTTATLAVPTLSEWAQLLLLALLVGGGLLALRRRPGGSIRPA
jgi:hypothetical protein